MKPPRIRVLVVDDSSVIRTLMQRLLGSDPDIEVVGTAPDPYVARDKIVALNPDVMTLDLEMPRMDGLMFLGKVMEHFPVRTLVVSSLTSQGASLALQALELGAIDVMQKPAIDVTHSLGLLNEELVSRVKSVATARLPQPRARTLSSPLPVPRLSRTTHQILAMAGSTGGTEAFKRVLSRLPPDLPGTLIVQHMPPVFTRTYASALQRICPFEIKEAEEGDPVLPGRALLAPGNFHMELERSGAYYYVKLHQAPPMHGVRPAADYLMQSVARIAGANAIGVVLTGMGKDGAQGLLAMHRAGAYNISQNEETCVVYGMPREAVHVGAIHRVLPLDEIADAILTQIRSRQAA